MTPLFYSISCQISFHFATKLPSIAVPEPIQKLNHPVATKLWEAIQVSKQQRISLKNLAQGSNDWLRARQGRLTASVFGSITGTNPYTNRKQLIEQL